MLFTTVKGLQHQLACVLDKAGAVVADHKDTPLAECHRGPVHSRRTVAHAHTVT